MSSTKTGFSTQFVAMLTEFQRAVSAVYNNS